MSALTWYWHRLKAMDASEVFGRVREKTLRHSERLARGEISAVTLQHSPQDVPRLPNPKHAPDDLSQTLAADAAALLAGRWKLYGTAVIQVPLPPSWHRDYVHNIDVPATGTINHRTLPEGADARTIWEISRWSELVRLAMHGFVNEDATAIATAQSCLEDWVQKNPVGEGINWTSALEASLRLINFCWFDALVRHCASPVALHRQEALAQSIVPAHVWWVQRYLSFGSSANNHRLGELCGLLLAVKRWPELEALAGTADHLWDHFCQSILTQFDEDGGGVEQALHYHLFAMEMAVLGCHAMETTDDPVMARLQKAALFFVRMSHADEPWDYGDSDDAQIVPLSEYRSQASAEWQRWLSGTASDGALAYWLGSPLPGLTTTSAWWIAPQSGLAVCDRHDWKLRLDASPLGFGKLAAHGHCDALHLSIWDGPHALLIDPGTGGYYGMKKQRASLAAWSAHNGPQPVTGFTTPQRMGTFLWAEHHDAPTLHLEDPDTITASFTHEGHHLTRCVEISDDGVIHIEDSIASDTPLRVRLHLAPECEIESPSPGSFIIKRSGQKWHLTFSGSELSTTITGAMVSPHYGLFVPCPVLEVTAQSSLKFGLSRASAT